MSLQDVVVVSALRTPVGNFGGALANVSAPELAATVIKQLLQQANIEANQVDEVILGNVLQAGLGQNPARQASIKAGLPETVPAMTVNKLCGSGLKTIHLAQQAIALGDADVVIAGGMENMSQAPYLSMEARNGLRMGDKILVDSMIHDGLTCAFNHYHMGITAENINERYGFTREEQDVFAVKSQQKAVKARNDRKFVDEIVRVEIPQRRGEPVIFKEDEYIREDATAESMAKLRPAFKKDGSVTAGNASGINDGAAAVLLMSRKKAEELGVTPMVEFVANANAALDPSVMGLGPIYATNKALQKAGLTIEEIDLIEANEAFAAQSLAVLQDLQLDEEKVNVNGGAIALGHPIGASGARVFVTLLHEMQRRQSKLGLATLCIGGGQGVASIVKNIE